MFDLSKIFNILSDIEPLVALPAILLSIYIYFRDPLKRWIFFGYLPTAVIVLYDPEQEKVLLITNKGTVGFPQGGIFGSDVVQTVEQTLKRELKLESPMVEIRYAKALGVVRIGDKYRTRRITIGTVSLFNQIKGKGYIAYFVSTDMNKIKSKIRKGYDIDKYEILDIKKAIKKLSVVKTAKSKYLVSALTELQDYIKLKN